MICMPFAAINVDIITQKLLCLYVLQSFNFKISCRPTLIFRDSVFYPLALRDFCLVCFPMLVFVFLCSFTITNAILIHTLDTIYVPLTDFLMILTCTLSSCFFFNDKLKISSFFINCIIPVAFDQYRNIL